MASKKQLEELRLLEVEIKKVKEKGKRIGFNQDFKEIDKNLKKLLIGKCNNIPDYSDV